MKTIVLAATVAALVGSPAFAQDRDTALRECAATSQKFTETTWGHMQMYQWRTCMTERGQAE